ncbi:DNA repair ATPase [Fulvivirgaceae bacterium BMA10]|uniref:DNA repair ATPase n=1 Tax=Splendidivirga corallicola TaxID=3051826 RepID=A0ABT8KHC7_9BACT|nr:DNA repair ATPase [Fulvivirgaceae bacterium BMA10]
MSENQNIENNSDQVQSVQLEEGTYEILRNRILQSGQELRKRLNQLNNVRKEVFGSIDTVLKSTERVNTENNCVPTDMVAIGSFFIFGYNVHLGLKTETALSDVFSVYRYSDHSFHTMPLTLIEDKVFKDDFSKLYKYYKNTRFIKFAEIGPHIHMVFRVGKDAEDIKTFKWLVKGDKLEYVDNRSDHEYVFPQQHEFEWKRTNRDLHREGKFPHISIEDKVFVETIGGSLTIKIEDNTDEGSGIYTEKVEHREQRLEDAEIYYAIVGNIIVLKIRPYQEKDYRYIVYNAKLQEARRIDALKDACVLLPDDHGVIFSNGYYLQTGEVKQFDNQLDHMLFEKRIASPNGEDFLYVFYNKESGIYLLLPYNLIEQAVENPLVCHGYSLFENGEQINFRADEEAKKHHAIQIWQTPYVGPDFQINANNDSYLYKIGNKEVVRAMAECHEILTLLQKEDSYTDLYGELIKRTTDIVDSYHWLGKQESYELSEPLFAIKETASSAVSEYEKVSSIKKNTEREVLRVTQASEKLVTDIKRKKAANIDDFVQYLAALRTIKGELIGLKELRYVEVQKVELLEKGIYEITDKVSSACVSFLLKEQALKPYQTRVEKIESAVTKVKKVFDANELENEIDIVSQELEMLIEIVTNLNIEDATHTTKIIDNISAIYSGFNQIRASLKRRRKELLSVEGKAEFNAQVKLIDQGVINYLDICDTPEKCDEYLTKLMVQLEELEGKFSEFDEFIEKITIKREEIYNAFESKKVNLIENRNRRANNLLQAADRILNAAKSRVARFDDPKEINGYFASDLMIEKIRDIVQELIDIGDTVKSDDIQSRLKTVKEDAIRQLKDKTELFVDGENLIQFGKYQFSVNTQPLDLTIIYRDGSMQYHLTGTNFFEEIIHETFNSCREVWDQHIISENNAVYRGEYLAFKVLQASIHKSRKEQEQSVPGVEALFKLSNKELIDYVRSFMAVRYNEGYVKGIHDHDASIILQALIKIISTADLLRYSSEARACATLYWKTFASIEEKQDLQNQLKGVGTILQVFPETREFDNIKMRLKRALDLFLEQTQLFEPAISQQASEYLFYELSRGDNFVIDMESAALYEAFGAYLKKKRVKNEYDKSINSLNDKPLLQFNLIQHWLKAYVTQEDKIEWIDYIDETACLLLTKDFKKQNIIHVALHEDLTGLQGSHATIEEQVYHFNYNTFIKKLDHYESHIVPLYDKYTDLKKQLIHEFESELRLNEFRPRVLSSFVRNRLIDQVYLPLIGANLAKQIGAAGEGKRTDLMGMLLLISPPGYGKTTLMEYLANRLGLIFMKINGPAIGHEVTAVDPEEAPNAGAREELEKLNLAFEMGDNVMIYLDDIQHCNPEFLQKFISLCDAQRKIEGVYKGRSKTYDFRGKKVCVVMAGNPYTESGEKFRIPDMLANRADIYNLGDIIGDSDDVFKLSYLENSLTSNPILNKLQSKSRKDVYTLINVAETGDREGIEFETNHAAEEINEYISIIKKLLFARDIILMVNKEYIYSAGQADEYRTEPQFKLQGSYRDMNKISEKIVPVMNDDELNTLIMSHYENEAQTLTTGAEANLLKFKEMRKAISKDEKKRWEEIKSAFQRKQRLKGFGVGNQMGQVLEQMESITSGLSGIKDAIQKNKKND